MARIAVLVSGGLDSAVLLADLARENTVFPVYVEAGLAWEDEEQRALEAYLAALEAGDTPDPAKAGRVRSGALDIQPLTKLEMPLRSLYGQHWSTTGEDVPGYDAPDEAVYLPGRNVLLIGVTSVWCALHDVNTIAIGSLDANPFPDATPQFFADYGRVLSGALDHKIEVVAPYRSQHKSEIIARFPALPLHLTLTCMAPRNGRHCGACNKCRERQEAFRAAGVEDKTPYAS
ncbi:MAG TPA: 7-cyano-7-deazaguanine synthase [Dehalococcoidia bacterium]|nr:7-cyano-7-deazaguanine synthase [Dehalococcoidia bacterium]